MEQVYCLLSALMGHEPPNSMLLLPGAMMSRKLLMHNFVRYLQNHKVGRETWIPKLQDAHQ